jgi:hypothetical protein
VRQKLRILMVVKNKYSLDSWKKMQYTQRLCRNPPKHMFSIFKKRKFQEFYRVNISLIIDS